MGTAIACQLAITADGMVTAILFPDSSDPVVLSPPRPFEEIKAALEEEAARAGIKGPLGYIPTMPPSDAD
jgi:hypothetical protein